jgi:3-isopropylmalate/(R)-2-methylmalate dehydratase small subunit
MDAFRRLTAVGVPLDEPNIDTNQLAPTRYSQLPRGPRYAQVLLCEQRFNADGSETDYILNREPYRAARIIVAERNFGCGSSRETAVYALWEFGIRCVIAPSFGDIFSSNCFKNGVLPVALPETDTVAIRKALHDSTVKTMTVDLEEDVITDPAGRCYRFKVNPRRPLLRLQGESRASQMPAAGARRHRAHRGVQREHRSVRGGLPKPLRLDIPR